MIMSYKMIHRIHLLLLSIITIIININYDIKLITNNKNEFSNETNINFNIMRLIFYIIVL